MCRDYDHVAAERSDSVIRWAVILRAFILRPFIPRPFIPRPFIPRPFVRRAVIRTAAGRWAGAVALVVGLLGTGCGYHTVGSAAELPRNIHTIAIPGFVSHSQTFRVEQLLTDADELEF